MVVVVGGGYRGGMYVEEGVRWVLGLASIR